MYLVPLKINALMGVLHPHPRVYLVHLKTYNIIKHVGSHKEPIDSDSDLNHCPPFRLLLSGIITAAYNIAKSHQNLLYSEGLLLFCE